MEDILTQNKSEPAQAQSQLVKESHQNADQVLSPEEFNELIAAQANHAIVQKFEKECSKTQLIDIYTSAYKFHQKEADKYKAMLT